MTMLISKSDYWRKAQEKLNAVQLGERNEGVVYHPPGMGTEESVVALETV